MLGFEISLTQHFDNNNWKMWQLATQKHSFETVFITRQFKRIDSNNSPAIWSTALDWIAFNLFGSVALRNEVWYEQLYDYFIFSSSVVFMCAIVAAYCISLTLR